jgi:arylsulfatase
MIVSDDMGYSDLGCYGGEIRTPNLDRLASDGMRFTRFYTNNMCVPTRAALMTGIQSDLAYRAEGRLTLRADTLAETLKAAGYGTYMTGKWHLADEMDDHKNLPCQRGFERFYGGIGGAYSFYAPYSLMRDNTPIAEEYENDPDYYFTDAITKNSIAFLEEAESKEQPFFLYVAYNAAHWPLHAREEDIAKYKGRYAAGWDELRLTRHARMKELGVVNPDWELSPRNPEVPAWEDEPHKEWQQRRMEVYAAQIEVMDAGIGRIIAELERQGRLDNTLICFQIDNGGCHVEYPPEREGSYLFAKTRDGRPMRPGNLPDIMPGPEDTFQSYGYGWANASNTPFRLYKQYDHEGGISVPLIAHWPGKIEAGALTNQLAHVSDLMPTFLEAAGASRADTRDAQPAIPMDGRSLISVMTGGRREPPDRLFWQWNHGAAVRAGQWKLVRVDKQPWELYDIEADGSELHDLAAEMPDKAAELEALWNDWAERRNRV